MNATSTPTTGTPPAIIAAFARAHARAAAAKLVAYKTAATDMYEVPSETEPGRTYYVRITGRRWYDLHCDCAGGNHVACKHRAVVAHGIKYHVWAKRPVATVERPTVAPVVADSAPEDVALSQRIKSEVLAAMAGFGDAPAHDYLSDSDLDRRYAPSAITQICGAGPLEELFA